MQSDPHLQAIECHMPAGVTYASGERALMCAILADALACLGGWCRQPGLAADARQWVASTDRHWPCSFENICDTLGFDAAHLRLMQHVALISRKVEIGSRCAVARAADGI